MNNEHFAACPLKDNSVQHSPFMLRATVHQGTTSAKRTVRSTLLALRVTNWISESQPKLLEHRMSTHFLEISPDARQGFSLSNTKNSLKFRVFASVHCFR